MAVQTLETPPASTLTQSALPPSTGEIKLGSSGSSAPKPTPARDQMRERMRSKFGDKPVAKPETLPAKPAEEPPKTETKPQDAKPTEITKPVSDTKDASASDANKPVAPEVKGDEKNTPWKLVKRYKEELTQAHTEILELKKQVVPEHERTSMSERLTKAEQRAKELDEEIRHVNYTKSSEFREKYEQPFQRAVGSAIKELNGMSFQDDKGVARQFDVNVLMELVNMSLPQARSLSNSLFGDLANDVMTHRNRIRENLDEQASAIETAKKTGAERDIQRQEQMKAFFNEVGSKAKEWWEGFNSEVAKHPEHGEFVKPKEGNEEWNTALEKGFEMAKRAFSVNVNAPNITPEQRKEAVKLQSALYNKAAAYGPMRLEIKSLRKALSERETELGKYKSTTPAAGGQVPQNTPTAPSNSKEAMFARLRSRATA